MKEDSDSKRKGKGKPLITDANNRDKTEQVKSPERAMKMSLKELVMDESDTKGETECREEKKKKKNRGNGQILT